jgi:hypothetical protein
MNLLKKYIRVLLEGRQSAFVRFGRWPENERSKRGVMASKDEGWEEFEEGVSVYQAIWNDELGKWSLFEGTHTLMHFVEMVRNKKISAFLVDGDYVGDGLDGEPLLRNIRPIKELECTDLYIPEFDFGHPFNSKDDCGVDPKEEVVSATIKDYGGKHRAYISSNFVTAFASEFKEKFLQAMGGPVELVGMMDQYSGNLIGVGEGGEDDFFVYKLVGSKDEYPLAISGKKLPI